MKQKCITISDEQDAWIEQNAINLSRFVQKAIELTRSSTPVSSSTETLTEK